MDNEVNTAEFNIDDIEQALSGLDMPDEVVETVASGETEQTEIVVDEGAIDAAVNELEAEEARHEIYSEAESAGDCDPDAAAAPEAPAPAEKKAKATKAKKKPAEKKERTPRVAVGDLPPDAFVLTAADASGDLDANKAAVMAKRPEQVKVAEKFDNLLTSISQGRAPSKFTMDAFRALKAAGSVTSKDLVSALEASSRRDGKGGLNIGTARSQAGQMMALFPSLKIATREGQKITLNPDSLLAEALVEIDAPKEAPAPAAA